MRKGTTMRLAQAARLKRLCEYERHDGEQAVIIAISRCGPNYRVATADGRRFVADRDMLVTIR